MNRPSMRPSLAPCAIAWITLGLQLPPVAAAGDPAATDGERGTVILLEMAPRFPGEALPRAERRAVAELRAIGLDVLRVEARTRGMDARLQELARLVERHEAMAAIRIVRNEGGDRVRLWLDDGVTEKALLRQVPNRGAEGQSEAAAVALHVVELLHASLLELRLPGERTEPAPEAANALVARALQPPAGWHRTTLGLGIGAAGSPGGSGAMGAVGAYAALRPLRWLRIGANAFVTALTARLSGKGGRARVGMATATLDITYAPGPDWPVSPALGPELGAAIAWARGDSEGRYEDRDDLAVAPLVGGTAAAVVPVGERSRLRARFSAGWTLPAVQIRFAGQPVAKDGDPLLRGTLAFEWALGPPVMETNE